MLNLVKTVPPAGVDNRRDSGTFLTEVKQARADALMNGPSSSNQRAPSHTLVTEYRYNTLNQVAEQKTPDAGISKFWYDRLGRLVVSQNAQQALTSRYSYTGYDDIGRIAQVGQKQQSTAMTQTISRDTTALDSWLNTLHDREQITRTVYDVAYYKGELPGALEPALYQHNLRNRVSYTQVFNTEPVGASPDKWAASHIAATYYSYDIHGNVDTLLQDYNAGAMATAGNRFKKIVYNYDLISGKVNEVAYQPGYTDQFFHRYSYDAENRLINVETSNNHIIWETDARYYYYRHGPLARTILGQNQVQGIDYIYTLQGWLKAVNSLMALPNSSACPEGTAFDDLVVYDRSQNGSPAEYKARNTITFEPGFESNNSDDFETNIDGSATACDVVSQTLAATDMSNDGSNSSMVARDAYGFTLHYYDEGSTHDYIPIGATQPLASIAPTGFNFTSLYNGNIGAMSVNVPQVGIPLFYSYRYDQLNRLKSMQAYKGLNAQTNSWEPISIEDYKEQFSYNPDGGILTLKRNGSGSNVIDNAAWHYYPGTHRLEHISDPAGRHGFDAGMQADNNYKYNDIGEMTTDTERGLTNISWNVYGKVTQQQLSDGRTINYTYDAAGKRISKQVTGTGAYTEWYVRDAAGNVLSIYRKTDSLRQTEQYKYGSSLLGLKHHTVNMEASPSNNNISTFTANEDEYYLKDHRGNNMVAVRDTRTQHDDNGDGIVDYYTANVATAQDYSSFGVLLQNRQHGTAPRFTYNGKELDKETGWQDYGMREYMGGEVPIFTSVDPLTKSFPFYSPYHFAGNSPITNMDLDGGEPLDFKNHWKYHNIFNPKSRASNGMNISVDDPKLGYVSVEGVYDNWTKQTWFIHQDNQGNYYYLKNLNGDNQTLRYTSDPSHKLVGGQFEKFETQDAFQARLNSQLADRIALFFAGGITAIVAAPTVPLASSTLISTSGLASATFQAEVSRRLGAAAADATIQGLQIATGRQDKFNYGSTLGSLLTSSPVGSAVWTTVGEVSNGEVNSSGNLLLKFTFNLGGNMLGDKITKGLIKNSSYSKAKDPITNAVNSYLGNISGGAGALVGSTYKDLNTSTK